MSKKNLLAVLGIILVGSILIYGATIGFDLESPTEAEQASETSEDEVEGPLPAMNIQSVDTLENGYELSLRNTGATNIVTGDLEVRADSEDVTDQTEFGVTTLYPDGETEAVVRDSSQVSEFEFVYNGETVTSYEN